MWFGRRERESDLERELRAHLDLEAAEQQDSGLSAEAARYAAQRAFGNTVFVKEEVRQMWGWIKLEQFAQDVRYALRGLRKNPGFAATAVVSLALGIGANTAIFTVVNAVLLRPLPFPDPERLVQLWETKPSNRIFGNVLNGFNFLDWRDRTHSFVAMAAIDGGMANLTGQGDPVGVPGLRVSPPYFSILGVAPALGHAFTPENGRPGEHRVVILSYALWQSRFGGDPGVLGRQLIVDGSPRTIIGVMPRDFRVPRYNPELWMPLAMTRSKDFEGGRYLTAIARLKPGVSLAQAQDDLHAVAQQSAHERPRFNEGWSAEAVPMLADATQKVRLPLLVLLAAVGLVLLIACANVANLLLMRASGRSREIAVRAALGAGKRRLVQQLLSESLVLALAACGAGIAGAWWGVKALVAMIPKQVEFPRLDAVHIDGSILLFAIVLSVVTAAIFGIVPSLQVSQLDPYRTLQQGSLRTTAKSLLRQSLVVAEIALSLILLIGAGLMVRSFHRLVSVNPGFETQRILTMDMFTSPAKYLDNRKRAAYFANILTEIRNVPGVREAGSTHFLPLQERMSGSCFAKLGDPPPGTGSPGANFLVVSPGYFRAMGTPLASGRHFDARDAFGAPHVIIVNREFAKRYFPDRDPLGQKLNVCWTVTNPVEIVGVVADARQTELQTAPQPTIFINNLQAPMFFAQLVVRAAGDPLEITRAVQAAVHRVDPDQALTHIDTMEHVFSDSVAQPRLELVLLAIFGSIAGLLAMIGIYGVVAYSAAQRTREMGIRMAVGAAPSDVRSLVLREGLILAAAGITIGLAGALALTRVLETLLFETTPTEPATLTIVSAGVLAIVLLATLLPANRAARVNPTVALRYE